MSKWDYRESDVDFDNTDTHALVLRNINLDEEPISSLSKLPAALERMMEGMGSTYVNVSEFHLHKESQRHKARWSFTLEIGGERKMTPKELASVSSRAEKERREDSERDRRLLLAIKDRNPDLLREMCNG